MQISSNALSFVAILGRNDHSILVKKIYNIYFLTFLILVLGTTNSPILPFITESKESIEEEEGCFGNHAAEDEKIKQTGAGGSGLEEHINPIFQKNIVQTARISLLLSVYFKSFSLKTYHNYLLNTLYFPKLYILFHCTKAFLS